MNRKDALTCIKVSGYHNDLAAFTRLYIENRISREAANRAYMIGAQQRKNGMRCSCYDCNKGKS
jgi:hypothetical protein